jgi:hypothetical protein
MEAISSLLSALGLAGSAGLNAYIPLLIVAVAGRFPADDPLLVLARPYDALTSWWAIGVLVVLLVVEMTADKIPVVDSINDGVQTFVRPAAGAILFGTSTGAITSIHPVFAIIAGIIVAGGVHAVKSTVRPAVTATTAGTGNWAVSAAEDAVAVVASVTAILIPVFAAAVVLAAVFWFLRRRRRR